MDNKYNETIRPILDVFDKIQLILRDEQIELPKIVVVGDQSSGKSSVLESITGISLPRGTGTVTKCPIIIQSRLARSREDEGAIISMEGYPDSDKISLAELSSKISEYQDKLISSNRGEITDIPININLNKLSAPDLTLYDLPGLTYKDGVTKKIREMILKYTDGKETIILLIIASNMDFRNTEAIELIQNNSDYKERTIAVLTKIDLGNQERGLYEKLVSNDLDLKFVVVRNRTQQEIDENVSIENIRQKEIELIENSDLRKLSQNSKGTSVLIQTLIEIQKKKLLTSEYVVREKINEKIIEYKKALSKLPKSINTLSEKTDIFRECVAEFSNQINNSLENRHLCDDSVRNITYQLRTLFEKDLAQNFQKHHSYFLSDTFFEKSKSRIHMARAFNLANFTDFKVFESIMISEFEKIEVETLLKEAKASVLNFLVYLVNDSFRMYPDLICALKQEINFLLQNQFEKAEDSICELLNMEKTFIYTSNTYYIDMVNKIKTMKKELKQAGGQFHLPTVNVQGNDQMYSYLKAHYDKDMSVVNVQISCFAYWKVVEKRFVDYFHMIIVSKLLLYFKCLPTIFDKKFSPNSNELSRTWINEEETTTTKREKCEKSLRAFEDAAKLMDTIC